MRNNYAKSFEKMFERCSNNAKSIFPKHGNHYLSGIAWIISVINKDTDIINEFNRFCLENNVNAILCNRFNILIFRKNKSRKYFPLNNGSMKKQKPVINSS
jgi:hypothetical protein